MTELRRRMEDDMVARGFAERTRESYLWAVTGLARFYRRPPDRISDEEVQAYLVHLLRERQRSWSTCNVVANGLRFFFHTTLKRDRTTFTIPAPRHRQTLPAILSREDVEHLIAHAPNPKYRTMLLTTYAAGLRLNEVRHLRVTDIDWTRMTLRVEQGKGARTGTRCCRLGCSTHSAGTGERRGLGRGCFRRRRRGSPCIPRLSNGRTTW
jgi:integrase